MTRVTGGVVLALAVVVSSCSSSPAAPAPPSVPTNGGSPGELAGTWTGSGVDSYSPERVQLTLTQSGATFDGRVDFDPVDPNDGSCASCHKLRRGVISGSISANALTLTITFPPGGNVPTPICRTDLTGTATIAAGRLTGTYSGTDTCEGVFANGSLTLTRQP